MDFFNVKKVTDELYRWWGAKIPDEPENPFISTNTIIPPSTPLFVMSPVKYLPDHPNFNEEEEEEEEEEEGKALFRWLDPSVIEISTDSIVPPAPEEEKYDDIHRLAEEFQYQTDDDSTFEAFARGSPMNSEFKKCVKDVIINSINDVVTKTLEEQSEEELDQKLDDYLHHLDQHLNKHLEQHQEEDNKQDISADDSLPPVPTWMLGLDETTADTLIAEGNAVLEEYSQQQKRGIAEVLGDGDGQSVDDVKRIKLDDGVEICSSSCRCRYEEDLNAYMNNSFCVNSATDVSASTCAFVDDISEEFEPECTSSVIDPDEEYDEEDWPAEEGSEGEEEYESEVNEETILKRKRKPVNFYYESSVGSYNTSDEFLYESDEDESEDDNEDEVPAKYEYVIVPN